MVTAWQELPLVARADVYKGLIHAAVLERNKDGVRFSYLPRYVSDNGRPVATTLPLTTEPVLTPAGAVPPFFAGLLPEGRRLTAIRTAIKTSPDDELSLLLAVGADTVGDVMVLPEGEEPQPVPMAANVDDPSQMRFTEVFAQAVGAQPDRVGIAGVQEKISAQMISIPVRRAVGQYILKLTPPKVPGLVENEAFFLDAARRSGLDVVEAKTVQDADGRMGLLVKRFDRVSAEDGSIIRLGVEDGCQVLGRYPAAKYSVTSEQVSIGLMEAAATRPVAARNLLGQFIFAYLSGNGDAHAKNFSILQTLAGEWRISPAYDLPSSYPYGDHTMALSIGGRRQADITRTVVMDFAGRLGLGERIANRTIDTLCEAVNLWIGDLDQLPFTQQRLRKLKRVIQYRRRQLRP